jgi:Cu(I)/Ag(I) efflux system membrane protein CusA/SilA
MLETTITLKPEKEWRKGMTHEKLVEELNAAIRFPGVTNAWTMPIKTRIDMLATGIKTPVGIKIMGDDLDTLASLGEQVEAVVSKVPGTLSAYAERITGGNYFDYDIRREEAARYGLTVGDVQDVIMSALGGMNVTTTVEGLERYPVNVRYPEEFRDNPESMRRILVPTPGGAQVPLGQLADISIHKGPASIKSENARRTVWIYVDIRGIDLGTYVKNAQEAVRKNIKLPAGYSLVWSGQFEYMERAGKRLMIVIPLTLLIVFLIIYMSTKSLIKTTIVLLAVPFSLVGAFWFIYLLGFNLSVAVWVGIIALAGLDAETGVVMLLYLEVAYESRKREKLMNTMGDLKEAIIDGAVKRIRPKVMTASVIIAGLIPIMWSSGTGSDVMKRIAAPMVGGVVTSVIMELLVYPVIYEFLKQKGLDRSEARTVNNKPNKEA